jgi:class 3 adenylate cyclase/tetratricopeptide (TPR) repeat protein
MDIGAWLKGIGLEEYAEAFAENGVDADLLPELTNEDLKDIGITRLADRKRLLKAITGLSEGNKHSEAISSHSIALEGERRQVTVLFADLSGFTQLSNELGAEATHGLLNRYFETVDSVVEAYGGTIDKHIGDNVMAVFGAPVAHTNDPERAVRAALEIHAAMPRLAEEVGRSLSAHIGIASGQVVASGTGSEAHREYTVTGDTVNLASRLDDRAGPGETLISKAVYDSISAFTACSAKGETSIKGLGRPIQIWSVDRLADRSTGHDNSIFVGRRAELGQFEALLNEALKHGQGNSILLRGDPGIGKTRLIEEFGSLALQNSVEVHKSLVLDFGVGKGQAPIPSLIRSLLKIPAGSSKSVRINYADKAIAEGLLQENHRMFLNELLDLRQPSKLQSIYDAMDNAARNTGQQETVVGLIEARGKASPLLINVEDIHWADRSTLDHLTKIAVAIADLPVLLVMTTRPEGPSGEQEWIASLRGSPLTMIELPPLRAPEALRLAAQFSVSDTSHLETFVARAEGNPLFIEQLTRGADEKSDWSLPDTLQGVVLARLDQLPERDREALRAASVLGQLFSLEALQELIGDAAYDCDIPVHHRLVRPEGKDYIFAHALIQDGVYSSLLQAQKRGLHGRAAQLFAEWDLSVYAGHLDRAEDRGAARAYIDAAKSEQERFRFEKALELVNRGEELAKEADDRYALSILHGELLQARGSFGPSIPSFQQAFAQSANDEDRCRTLIGEALGLLRTDQHTEAEIRLQ